jgi:hypothetical protein
MMNSQIKAPVTMLLIIDNQLTNDSVMAFAFLAGLGLGLLGRTHELQLAVCGPASNARYTS